MVRFKFVRQAILAERSHARRAAIALLGVIVPTALRAVLDTGDGVPFVTYFPAIAIVVLVAGWEYAAGCAVLSAAMAYRLFLSGADAWAPDRAGLATVAVFLASCAVLIAVGQSLRSTVREFESLAAREAHLNTELQHRVKNILAVVQALAQQSAREPNPAEFARTFGGRLRALAQAHDVLSASSLESCAMPDLVARACEPFGDANTLRLAGPCCRLPAVSCVPLALAIHELCTNAIKHGSLSAGGRVDIAWLLDSNGRCVITWRESGGPPVSPPTRVGLGRRLLTAQPGLTAVDLDFAPDGLRCTITIAGATRDGG